MLAEELGIDPAPALRELHEQILRGEVTSSKEKTPMPRQLPPELTTFVGREGDVERLGASAARVLVITGTGGVGKTSLAVHWAHRIAGRFEDGQIFVNLRGQDPVRAMSPQEALTLVLKGLGVESAPVGKAVYTLLCMPHGGIVDDCIFYKRADDDFMVIFNAGNIEKDLAWFREHASTTCDVVDVSDETALIAVQGPKAVGMLDALSGGQLAQVGTFAFRDESPEHWVEVFRNFYGPTHMAFRALDADKQQSLEADLIALLKAHDVGGSDGLVVRSEYLETVITR